MKKNILTKFVVLFSLVFILLGFNFAQAEDVNINLQIKVGSNNLYNGDISVSACDSNNDGDIDEATAYCALFQSKLNIGGSWSAFGYYLDSINNISGYPDANGGDYHYWAFYSNGEYSPVGANSYLLKSGDVILFDFTDPSAEDIAKASTPHSGRVLVQDKYYIDRAIKFLSLNEEENGGFGNSLYTDWVAIGVAKTDEKNTSSIVTSLTDYMKNQKFEASSITDYERHAMALMALGINPYNGTDINYISKIVNSFDGEQIGEKDLINDDIFALIVLQNAGYGKDDVIINKIISNILNNQSVNGSWGSVDMTGASIMALYNFKEVSGVSDSIVRAYKFIKSNEKKRGNFGGNAFSTSWAMQAFSLESWYEDEVLRSLEFLTREQHTEDGFIRQDQKENRIWATAYSIPAVLNMSWVDIMDSFPKQEVKLIKNTIIYKKSITKLENLTEELGSNTQEEIILDGETNEDMNLSLNNLFKDKVIILTLILVFIVSIGGWFVLKR